MSYVTADAATIWDAMLVRARFVTGELPHHFVALIQAGTSVPGVRGCRDCAPDFGEGLESLVVGLRRCGL